METASSEKRSVFDWTVRGMFFLLIVLVPLFFSLELTTYTLPKVVLTQILVLLLLGAWMIRMTVRGDVLFKPSMLFYPILVFFVVSVASLYQAMSLPGGVSLLCQVFAYVAVYFLVINHFGEEEIETWVLILTLVGLLHSAYGILQYFGIEPLLKGLQYIPHTPFSTLGHRNQVSQYLLLLIPLSAVFSFLTASRLRQILLGTSALAMIYHLYLTQSRGGILGFLFALFLCAGILLYRWLSRSDFFQRRRWVFPCSLALLILIPALLLFLPTPITLRAKYVNPIGYYIGSIDGSKIPGQQVIRIDLDYRILRGDPKKPGYVNLYGERVNTPPIPLSQEQGKWNHLRKEESLPSVTPGDDLKLRWVPGSGDSVLQVKNVVIETPDGVRLTKDVFLDHFFSKLGVTELDKVVSSRARLSMYRNTVEMIKDEFLLGVGFGNFRYVYPRYRDRNEWALSGLNTRVDQAHSEYLQIFSEVGLIGLLAFFWILAVIGKMILGVIGTGDFGPRFWRGIALAMGIVATLIQSLFDFNLQNPASGVLFWIAIGFLEVLFHAEKAGRGEPEPPSTHFRIDSKGLRGALVIGLLICLTGGLYYSARQAAGDFYLKRGRVFAEMKDWEAAFYYFERTSHFSPYNFDAYFHLGQTCDLAKDYERAVVYYRQAVRLHPYFIEARNNLGAVYIRLGQIDEAVEEFKASIELNPYYPGSHNNLGYLYTKRNLFKQALDEYQKTLELDPQNPEVHKNLGLLFYYKFRDYPRAKIYWERYLVLNPGDPQNSTIREKVEEIERGRRSTP